MTTTSECKPNDPYGRSEYEAEKILKNLQNKNFKVAIIRPPMIYGSGVKGNMLNLIKPVDKFPILPLNYDENKRSIVYIDNLLEGTKNVIEEKLRGIRIPQNETLVSIKEITLGIAKELGKKGYLLDFQSLYTKFFISINQI